MMLVVDVNAARVEKEKEKKGKEGWKNLIKILKQKQEKEKTYALGKSIRSRTWEPTNVVEEVVEEVEDIEVEVEEVAKPVEVVEQLVKKPRAPRRVIKREKYIDK